MVNEKVIALIRKLHDLTIKGKLDWEETGASGVYSLSFPDSSIHIFESNSDIGPDIVIQIFNSEASIITEVNDEEISDSIDNSFTYMNQIYQNARSHALKIDTTIDDILGNLEKDEPPF
jgi:hypothetical protein